MKDIKELLIIMSKSQAIFCSGLCAVARSLFRSGQITYDECCVLMTYIQTHRPKWYQYHYNWMWRNEEYYWPKYAWKPRLRWLKSQIRKAK